MDHVQRNNVRRTKNVYKETENVAAEATRNIRKETLQNAFALTPLNIGSGVLCAMDGITNMNTEP